MTLRENEKKRYTRARPAAAYDAAHDNQVLTFLEWCALNRLSERTGRRILAGPHGPTVVQLSTYRIGITVGANRRWQESRER